MSIIKMRGPIDVLFAFKIFSLPVPTRPGTRTFWQVPDPSRPEVKNPYPSDPGRQWQIPPLPTLDHDDENMQYRSYTLQNVKTVMDVSKWKYPSN